MVHVGDAKGDGRAAAWCLSSSPSCAPDLGVSRRAHVLPGHVDLALSMGHALSYGASVSNTVPAPVAQAMERIDRACAARNIPVIPVAGTPAEFERAQLRGQRIACCNTDFHLFTNAAREQLQACRAVTRMP